MAHLNIERVSLAARDREKEIQKRYVRKKTILVLIAQYLEDNGCVNAADVLKSECNFNLSDSSVCDNISLDSILQDFESYHFLRYQKPPQVVKKVYSEATVLNSNRNCKTFRSKSASKQSSSARNLFLESTGLSTKQCDPVLERDNLDSSHNKQCSSHLNNYIPLVLEKCSSEWQLLADLILQDIGSANKTVYWSDIVGLERAKQVLKEAVIYPLKYKDLFTSGLTPWKSMLLYGPTGTGKTSLAAAVATESKAMFFNVSASTLVSKWRGESEKLVKVLFELAKQYAPSVIFIDEIDSLISHRGADHEASRRMKTEFFSQIDSIFNSDKCVFLLGATNIPWELDQAILRRMEKRLLIPLPDLENRILLFKKFLPSVLHLNCDLSVKSELNYETLAVESENFSATDIELVCKEVKMNLLRKVFHELENSNSKINLNCATKSAQLNMPDLLLAIRNTKPSNINLTEKYSNWKENHGCE